MGSVHSDLRWGNENLQATAGAAVMAWHAVTGKVPVLWTEAALGGGVERPKYEKLLRWYGVLIRKKKLAAFASGAARVAEALGWLGWALPMLCYASIRLAPGH